MEYRIVTRLFAAVAVTAVAVPACAEPAPPLHPWGIPETDHPDYVVLNNTSYDVCYSTSSTMLSPLWAAYYYYHPHPDSDFERLTDFYEDPRLEPDQRTSPEDFDDIYEDDKTGYDRGHVAPHANLEPFGEEAIEQSYYVTNITPQHTNFNRGFWRTLERKTRGWAGEDDTVWVVTGPVFSEGEEVVYAQPAGRAPIPHAYFQVVIRMDRSSDDVVPETQAFLVPHTVDGFEWGKADSFLVAIDEIGGHSGDASYIYILRRVKAGRREAEQHTISRLLTDLSTLAGAARLTP
jgi:DNA/RNA endonuclease G (NUC1)